MNILAQKGDPESWMQLIVFIIIAVVYGLTALLKSKFDDKSEQEGEEEYSSEDIKHRAVKAAERRIGAIKDKQKPPRPAQKKTKHPETFRGKNLSFSAPVEIEKKPSNSVPEIFPEKTKKSGLQNEQDFTLEISAESKLQEAMIHFEIFGKPVSLRTDDKSTF